MDAEPREPRNRPAAPGRFQLRLATTVAAALAAAAAAAGYALATARSTTPIGTGVVVVDTNLAYQGGQAAGTGMVLTSSGRILTNNHVIRGATTIRVVVPGTGRSYTARVVGYDVADDVAVLQAAHASHLKTVSLGTSAGLKIGQAVKAVGNAGGGGTLVTTVGRITAVGRTITVSDDAGATTRLRNLIETSADLQPGDSGGPLLDTAGKVIGMDSAASVSTGFGYRQVSSSDGYAIPIDRARSIVKLIVAGKSSATVHVGATAFLGIAAASPGGVDGYGYSTQGAVVTAVVPGSPADASGLVAGDVLTAIDGKAVVSPATVGSVVRTKKPGATVVLTYLDPYGSSQTVRVTLASGPPQ